MSHLCAYINGICWGIGIGMCLMGGIYQLPFTLWPVLAGLFIAGFVAMAVARKEMS